MAGIYIHIPFCKQACTYCDFHFSTSLKTYNGVIKGIISELISRREELSDDKIETIYFGGGTPSQLKEEDLSQILKVIEQNYQVAENVEITIETNPDDIDEVSLVAWKKAGINRLSIGIQSFFDDDLKWMNRAHNSVEAENCVLLSKQIGFRNITIDLIYGLPNDHWSENIEKAIDLDVSHISSYALMIEPKTALFHQVENHKVELPEDSKVDDQYLELCEKLKKAGYEHYEISNFAKKGFRSKHNSAYWKGIKYMGVGPAAHSFDGKSRRWNLANNALYIKELNAGGIFWEDEELSVNDQFNEYIMTSLRKAEGASLDYIDHKFGEKALEHLWSNSQAFQECGKLNWNNDNLVIPEAEWFRADSIISDLFIV